MAIKFTNNASATLASSISAAATTITLSAGQGALFPTLVAGDYFYATLTNPSNILEIVRVTARSGDILTVTRGQEGTTASAYSAGNKLELRPTAAGLTDISTGTNMPAASTSAAGLVQLNNTVSSTSTTQAATANAVKTAYDLANAAMPRTGGTFTGNVTGTYISVTGSTAAFYFDDRGGSGVGNWTLYSTTGTARLYSGASSSDLFTFAASGNFTAVGNVTAYSDERVKTNWAGLPIDFIERLAGVKHGLYDRTDTGERQVGVSAQSLQALLPEAVLEQDGQLSVAYGNAALVACIALADRVVALEKELAALKG